MIAIIDYGVGNLFSLKSTFSMLGEDAVVTGDRALIKKADRLILPGVGAFEDAAKKLRDCGLDCVIKEEAKSGKAILGICLGMQLLFDKSFEYGEHDGLGLIKGNVKPIRDVVPNGTMIPHIGWNSLKFENGGSPLFKYINEGDHVYFVHSYYGADCDSVIATTDYFATLTAAVGKENVMGTQFHPEKSGETGLKILKSFCEKKL